MQITNYFDLKFIINLSISITISLFIVFILGKAVSDSIADLVIKILKSIGISLLREWFPVKFTVGFPTGRISDVKLAYTKHEIVNFGKINQPSLPAYGTKLFIKGESKFPFLYEGQKIRVELIDSKNILGIYSHEKLHSNPPIFSLCQEVFENNIIKNIHFDFKPQSLVDNYQIQINIFFQGKLYKNNLYITITQEK